MHRSCQEAYNKHYLQTLKEDSLEPFNCPLCRSTFLKDSISLDSQLFSNPQKTNSKKYNSIIEIYTRNSSSPKQRITYNSDLLTLTIKTNNLQGVHNLLSKDLPPISTQNITEQDQQHSNIPPVNSPFLLVIENVLNHTADYLEILEAIAHHYKNSINQPSTLYTRKLEEISGNIIQSKVIMKPLEYLIKLTFLELPKIKTYQQFVPLKNTVFSAVKILLKSGADKSIKLSDNSTMSLHQFMARNLFCLLINPKNGTNEMRVYLELKDILELLDPKL